ncbi:MAG: hypothetical protein RL064_1409 [Bacteroidota bacterium]
MLITDLQYFGCISYIKELYAAEQVGFDNEAPFSKRSFKNRMVIASAQGPLHLTIPIVGGRDQKTPLHQIAISYEAPWHEQHLKAILTNYKRSPFLEYYIDSLAFIYNSKPTNLVVFLQLTNNWIKKQLKGNWEQIECTAAMKENKELYLTQRKIHAYLPNNFQQFSNPVTYQQVFQERTGFIPNLSIIDLLFCCGGKQAASLLKAS